MQQPPNGMPLPVGPKHPVTLEIEYLDGTKEELVSADTLQLQPGFLLVPMPRDAFISINLAAVRRWEATPVGLAVVRGN